MAVNLSQRVRSDANVIRKKKAYFAKQLKDLHKRYPNNKYELVTVKNKLGREIENIKLISGKKYKKTKTQRDREKNERENSKSTKKKDIWKQVI